MLKQCLNKDKAHSQAEGKNATDTFSSFQLGVSLQIRHEKYNFLSPYIYTMHKDLRVALIIYHQSQRMVLRPPNKSTTYDWTKRDSFFAPRFSIYLPL